MVDIRTLQLVPQLVATLHFSADRHELSQLVENHLTEVWAYLEEHGSGPAGPPLSVLHHLTRDGEVPAPSPWDVATGFPIQERVPKSAKIHVHELPGGEAISITHEGDYTGLLDVYLLLQSWLLAHDREPSGPPWEVYLTDPGQEMDPDLWQTQVVWPLRGA